MIKNKIFFLLSGFYFFYFAAVGVYIIYLPKILNDIGYNPIEIGILFALSPLMRFLTPFLFLKHIKLTHKTFKLSLLLSFILVLLFYITIDNFYLFLINNALLGTTFSLLLPYIEVIAINYLAKDYGKSRLYGSVGFIIISLVLGEFLTSSFVAINYYLLSLFFLVIFGFSLIKFDTKDLEKKENSDEFSLKKYKYFWISLFLMQVSFGGFYNFFTIYESNHGISLSTISFLWSFGVICEIVMFYFQKPILEKNLLFIIKLSIFLTAIRWLILYIFPQNLFLTFISQSFHAFSFGLYHSAVVLYLYKIYENKKLSQQFMLGISYGLGGFAGAIISGYLYGENLFLYSALITLSSLFILNLHTILKKI